MKSIKVKRYLGAPDLRNPEHTAEAICSVVDMMFHERDRLIVKVYCIRLICNWRSGEALKFLGVTSNNHTKLELDLERKDNSFKRDLRDVINSFGRSITNSHRKGYKKHLITIIERL